MRANKNFCNEATKRSRQGSNGEAAIYYGWAPHHIGSSRVGRAGEGERLGNDGLGFVGIGAFVAAAIDGGGDVVVGGAVLHGRIGVAQAKNKSRVDEDVTATAGGAAVDVIAGDRGRAGVP